MGNRLRKKQNVMAAIQKHVKNIEWPCVIDGCFCKAINSHLLQRNGILSEVGNGSNTFYEIRTTDANLWINNEYPIAFKRVGIKEALSLKIFCNTHDTGLFLPIEQRHVDFEDYTNQLLFCLRTTYSEIRKKEMNIEQFMRMKNSHELALSGNGVELVENAIEMNRLGIHDLYQDRNIINDEISNPTNRIHFLHRTFTSQDVYASATVSYDNMSKSDLCDSNTKMDSFFFNIVPYNKKLHLLIGYDTSDTNAGITDYINIWKNCTQENLGQLLTGIFASKIENWGMSEELYKRIPESKREAFMALFADKMYEYPEKLTCEFNLFEGVF